VAGNFNYLLSMKLWTLTFEKVQQLRDQHQKKVEELQEMKRKTAKDLWLHDLERFEEAYTAYVVASYLG
jgi:DNA topoisomerase-2